MKKYKKKKKAMKKVYKKAKKKKVYIKNKAMKKVYKQKKKAMKKYKKAKKKGQKIKHFQIQTSFVLSFSVLIDHRLTFHICNFCFGGGEKYSQHYKNISPTLRIR